MADQEEDFSSLPLSERFAHKNWKVRKEAYEAAAKEFDAAQTEADPVVKQFTQDPTLWKGAVSDSNAAAHQEALSALCSFLQIAGKSGCVRTRYTTLIPLAEKGLISAKPAAKQKALEAILLYIEMDVAGPVVDELLPLLSHKLPKIIAAVLSTFTSIYHAYGCKTVEPKPVVQALPKVFGHADKSVRAEAQNLTVELYRWLRDSIKPLFWNDLKPVQQQDLEKLFDKVKGEPPPKPERSLKSQQATVEIAAASGTQEDGAEGGEEDAEEHMDAEPQFMATNVFPMIPKDLQERLSSQKWKDRKEALDDLHTAVNAPAIEEGPFDEIVRALAKCMKDANIGVVTAAANCVELLAKGIRKSFAKYRAVVFNPLMERLKERKQSVTDALTGALDAVCAASSLGDCLEETLGYLTNKNPLIKLEATRFLVRNLKSTKEAPSIPDTKSMVEACLKLLTDSQDNQRNAGAEVLGVLWKIMGDRVMNVHFEGLDDIRKAKIKEYMEGAEVRSKYKPKAVSAPPPKPAPASTQKKKKPITKAPAATKKPAPAPKVEEPASPPLQPRPTARPGGVPRPGASTNTAPRGLKPPTASGTVKKLAAPSAASPQRVPQQTPPIDDDPIPAPKIFRGLTGRHLSKPGSEQHHPAASTSSNHAPVATAQSLPPLERLELDELRAESERLRSSNEALRAEHLKLSSQVHELQNQNAQLIEDHTRDVLSVKAKETQLVRARSDAESAEQSAQSLQREVDRLKRELGRMGRATSPRATAEYGAADLFPLADAGGAAGVRRGGGVMSPTFGATSGHRGEGKENHVHGPGLARAGGSSKDVKAAAAPPFSPSHKPTGRSEPGSSRRPLSSAGRPRPQAQAPPSNNANGFDSSHGSSTGGAGGFTTDSDAKSSRTSDSSREGGGGGGLGGGGMYQGGGVYQGGANGNYTARRGGSGERPAEKPGPAEGNESWKRAAEVTVNLRARIDAMKQRQMQQRGR